MKVNKHKAFLASTIILSLNVSAHDIYIVKKGDTLTSILFSNNMLPIYGKRGSLAETLKLNPKINSNAGNKIFPFMKIVLVNPKLATKIITAETESKKQKTQLIIDETRLGEAAIPKAKTIPQQTTTNERLPSDNFKQSFYWELSPTVSWKSLTSSDENIYRSSTVTALSNTNYGLSAAYGMHFEEKIDIYSKLRLESVSFVQDASVNLVQKKFLTTSFGVGFSYDKRWLFDLSMTDEFFLTSPSVGNVDVKKVTLPEFKTTYLKDFYQYRNAKLAYSLSASAFLPRTSPEVTSKFSYGVGGAIEAKLHNQAFRIGYDLNLLKATGNSTNSNNIYWKYVWETL